MQSNDFYKKLVYISQLNPDERRGSLIDLHKLVYKSYLDSLRQITPRGAILMVPDGRSVAQVVGHIIEWDRAVILALGEILAGVNWPRIMSRPVNIDPKGRILEFSNTDEFNAYYAGYYADIEWQQIQTSAENVATTLHRLFTNSTLMTAERLEDTRTYERYELPDNFTLSMPCGWYLWMITVEHEGIEHNTDLNIGRSG